METVLRSTTLFIGQTWDGGPIASSERVTLRVGLDATSLTVDVDAPFHGDPAPPGAPGPCDALWEYEVVELFLLGDDRRYLEIELSPHGHHLVLQLHGARHVVASRLDADYDARIDGAAWRGRARFARSLLPAGLRACNAYAIHGVGRDRRYLAAHAVPGPHPDFHRLEDFAEIAWREGAAP